MWTPLPRRFWFRSTSHNSPFGGRASRGERIDRLLDDPRAEDGVALDAHAVGLPDVDAVQGVVDVVVDDRRPGAGHVDGGMVLPEVEAGSADLEAVEDDVGGANRDRVRAAIADEVSPRRRRAGARRDR